MLRRCFSRFRLEAIGKPEWRMHSGAGSGFRAPVHSHHRHIIDARLSTKQSAFAGPRVQFADRARGVRAARFDSPIAGRGPTFVQFGHDAVYSSASLVPRLSSANDSSIDVHLMRSAAAIAR